MDKNTLIGFGLIALILIGFSLFNRPSKEELAKRQHERDSIAYIQQIQRETDRLSKEMSELVAHKEEQAITDEQLAEKMQGIYGAFSSAAIGQNEFVVLENDLLRLTFQTEGGKLYKAELKKYKTYGDSLNYLSLFEDKEAAMNFTFVTKSNRILNTGNLFFTPQPIVLTPDSAQMLTMRLMTDSAAYLDFVYTLPQNNYMLQFDITPHQMQQVLALNATSLEMNWSQLIPQQERGRKFEERYATLQYMYKGGDIENLSESKQVKEDVNGRLKWIAYKDQFFSTVLIADGELYSAQLTSTPMEKNSGYIKAYQTRASLAFDPSGTQSTKLRMYLGPNHYNTLKAYDKGKEKSEKLYLKSLVPLGWKIVSWINMWLVIPMFDLFMSWGMHIGWVILLMTIVIKLIILPFTFQSYRSSAKMRVLKPQVDAINEKYPADKMQERQQATMALYQKAGASPMSGCLPMLFQFPVLMAMFWFFPTAIELRGQSLFWADDLSTYDAILTWNRNIPVISWIFGNHLSLFCLLMTVTNLIYTWINMQSQNTGNDPAAKMMRWMMYLMPLMFMYIFNDYAAGLSYYYFLSLLITIIQTYIFRLSINDEKLLKQMEARAAKNANKPKKSGLMARLEKMQREQQQYMREQAKRGRR
ncbi:MAG: membrane protein insertase YidC [Paludibacteraceae bacterium]|nr:membrane protein insertase YidC [Paludibacteraceae bacterium]